MLSAGLSAKALTPSGRPPLVVNIVVDGLESRYLDILADALPPGGLKRLMQQGAVLNNVDYGTALDATAATAVLMTGAAPSVNGIGSERQYDPATFRTRGTLSDGTTMGNFTDETYSPAALQVSTLGDEVKIAGGGVPMVYSIAASPSQAILLAGHAANSAVWLSDANAQWATTTYYTETPTVIANRNRLSPLRLRLDTMSWAPLKQSAATPLVPEHLKAYPFRHIFPRANQWRVTAYKATPLYNDEVTALALDYIKALGLGRHDEPDMLSLGMSVTPYQYGKNADTRFETSDAYLRLDASLRRLFDGLDKAVGPGQALVTLAATPPTQLSRREDERWRLPHGQFSTQRAQSLLNLYLVAKLGNGQWVRAWHQGGLYLNTALAEQQHIEPATLRREAAAFMRRMAGVNQAYTIDDILDGRTGTADAAALRRNTVAAAAPDVNVILNPGWEVIDAPASDTGVPYVPMVARSAAPVAPFYIMGPGVKPQVIDTPVDARAIAPTVAAVLRIRPPNGASLPPISL